MKLFALPASFDGTSPLELCGAQFHHVARDRRIRQGARPRGRTPDGRTFQLSAIRWTVADRGESHARAWEITLPQCIPKGPRLEQIVWQAVEAGVSRIVPVSSERSLVGDRSRRLQGLHRIAREAMDQSGALRLAVIGAPVALESLEAGPGRVFATLEGTEGFVYSPRSVEQAAAAARLAFPAFMTIWPGHRLASTRRPGGREPAAGQLPPRVPGGYGPPRR